LSLNLGVGLHMCVAARTVTRKSSLGTIYVCAGEAWYWKFDKNCNDL